MRAGENDRQIFFDPHHTPEQGNKAQAQLLSVFLGLCQSREGNRTAVLQCQHVVTGALPLESGAFLCPGVISRTGSAEHN